MMFGQNNSTWWSNILVYVPRATSILLSYKAPNLFLFSQWKTTFLGPFSFWNRYLLKKSIFVVIWYILIYLDDNCKRKDRITKSYPCFLFQISKIWTCNHELFICHLLLSFVWQQNLFCSKFWYVLHPLSTRR